MKIRLELATRKLILIWSNLLPSEFSNINFKICTLSIIQLNWHFRKN